MYYLIVPVGATPPVNEGAITGMDFIHAFNQLAAAGVAVGSIAAGLAVWNQIAKSGRWKNYKEAQDDPEFWETFKQGIEKK